VLAIWQAREHATAGFGEGSTDTDTHCLKTLIINNLLGVRNLLFFFLSVLFFFLIERIQSFEEKEINCAEHFRFHSTSGRVKWRGGVRKKYVYKYTKAAAVARSLARECYYSVCCVTPRGDSLFLQLKKSTKMKRKFVFFLPSWTYMMGRTFSCHDDARQQPASSNNPSNNMAAMFFNSTRKKFFYV